jgi:hypothetical protein
MILASAIKFHIEKTNEDLILCGSRHGDIFQQIKLLGFETRKGYIELEQGFITHKNEFLNRKQAYEHAKQCGQLSSKIIYERENGCVGGKNLISEDLW